MWTSFIRNPKDFWSGAIFAAFGLAAIVIGRDYQMGTAGSMGPAYFPSVIGGLLVLVGLISLVRSCVLPGEALGKFAFKPVLLILGGTVLFGLLVRGAGLFLAIIALVMLGGLASARFKAPAYLALSIGIAAFCTVVFVLMLGVPMPIFGAWFGN